MQTEASERIGAVVGRDEGNNNAKKIHGFEQLLARVACQWLALQKLRLSKGLQGSFLQAPGRFLTLNCSNAILYSLIKGAIQGV